MALFGELPLASTLSALALRNIPDFPLHVERLGFKQQEHASPGSYILVLSVIRDPKPDTWYFGIRCKCSRWLAIAEDMFSGKGPETSLTFNTPAVVKCACGAETRAHVLEKFRHP